MESMGPDRSPILDEAYLRRLEGRAPERPARHAHRLRVPALILAGACGVLGGLGVVGGGIVAVLGAFGPEPAAGIAMLPIIGMGLALVVAGALPLLIIDHARESAADRAEMVRILRQIRDGK
jgi:hypothetical protein